jgi:cysteine desulfurase/selenocysteine lyase
MNEFSEKNQNRWALEVKQQFPIFQSVAASGRSSIYLDNAATTHKPAVVTDRIAFFYQNHNANVHRGVHHLAVQATAAYEEARETVRQFIGAAHREEVIFTSGATESINTVAQGMAHQLKAGDEVLITAMEHHANLVPWQQICQQTGARLCVCPIQSDGTIDLAQLDQRLTEATRILAIVHISNTLGTINPIEKIIPLARAKDIPVLIDAAQSAATYPIDVQSMDCDYLVFSGHKAFGPTGIGVLYGKKSQLAALKPLRYGGEMIRTVSFEASTFAPLPYRLEAGTPNIAGAVGLAAALRFIQGLGKEKMLTHLKGLAAYARQQLLTINDVELIGTAPDKAPIFSFILPYAHPHDIATILNEYGIAIRAGHHCTQPLMRIFEVPATARASFSIYNTTDDVDALVEGLKEVERIMKGG